MSTRTLVSIILGLLIIGGLFAGLFAGSIQMGLTLHAMSDMIHMGQPPVSAPAKLAATPTMSSNMLAQDTFQRANQALWGTASDGLSWNGDANNPGNRPIFSIAGATGQISGGQGTLNALLGPTVNNVDVELTGLVNHFGGGTNLGAVLRWNDNNNWYKAFIDGTHLSILKRVNGVTSVLGTVPFKAVGSMSYKLRFRARGATIFARTWRSDMQEPPNWMLTITDTAFTTGYVGVRVLVLANTVVNVSSFMATNV